MIDTVMLFSAGLGNRMRHLTENSPKSLIPILGKPILHYALELCLKHPFKKIVINKHYLHERIEESVQEFIANNRDKDLPEIVTIYEEELLETGGAIKNAIDIIGNSPLFTLNTDVIIKSTDDIFKKLENSWDSERMEFLLLLRPTHKIDNYDGYGDFDLLEDGRVSRRDTLEKYPYVYTGLQILNPRRIAKNPLKIFSLREYYFNSNKVFGVSIDGIKWYHASCPEDIVDIELTML